MTIKIKLHRSIAFERSVINEPQLDKTNKVIVRPAKTQISLVLAKGPSFLHADSEDSQLIRFARVCSHVADFNTRNKSLTAILLQQGYRYHKLRKTFSKFYRRHYELVFKFNVGLKPLLHQRLSKPEFYSDLVYKFQKQWR